MAIQAICISMGVDVSFWLFQHNEGVRSNVGTGCNVMAPLQGGYMISRKNVGIT